jgi:phage gp46-like protein
VLSIPSTRATRPNLTTKQEATDNINNTYANTTECLLSSQERPRLQQMEEDSAEISHWPDSPEARHLVSQLHLLKSRWTLAAVDMTDDANETAKEALQS